MQSIQWYPIPINLDWELSEIEGLFKRFMKACGLTA